MPKKIAYFKVGRNYGTNKSISEMLAKSFLDFHIDTIDLLDIIQKMINIILINLYSILKECGLELICQ
jgi:hypothetical protein